MQLCACVPTSSPMRSGAEQIRVIVVVVRVHGGPARRLLRSPHWPVGRRQLRGRPQTPVEFVDSWLLQDVDVAMSGLRTLVALLNQQVRPLVLPNAHVSPSATVIGNVLIADHVFIKPNAVLRGDSLVPDDVIRLGGYTSIGENSVLNAAVQVGSWCRIGVACHIGRGARIGNEVALGDGTLVGAGAHIPHRVCTDPHTVVPEGARLESNSRYAGNPAVRVGDWSGVEVEDSVTRARAECALGARHAYEFLPLE